MSTTIVSNLSSAHPELVHSFLKHGRKLSNLLIKTKAKTKESLQQDIESIGSIREEIHRISARCKEAADDFPETFPREKIFPKAFQKIKTILERVMYLTDGDIEAKRMLDLVNDALRKLQEAEGEEKKKQYESNKSVVAAAAATALLPPTTNAGAGDNVPPFPWNDHKSSEFFNHTETYKNLDEREQNCLSFCRALLGTKVSQVEMNKRELIHWWIGMGFIKEPSEGEQVLAKLVAEEFLIKTSSCSAFNTNPKTKSSDIRLSSSSSTNSYIIHSNTVSNIPSELLFLLRKDEEGSHRPLYMFPGQKSNESQAKSIVVAINRRMFKLNAEFFQKYLESEIDKDSEKLKILHLGSWPYDPKRYVVVEDIEALNSFLSNTSKLTSLSLRGILGVIQLPKSIFNIKTLGVIDLKSCTNLETIPKEIFSLSNLTHLDVSECYLLEHIPKGIESLTELRVLKGFIIVDTQEDSKDQISSFEDLSKLDKLVKLDIHARVSTFPTPKNLKTLSDLQKLEKLKITWVVVLKPNNDGHDPSKETLDDTVPHLPATLVKLDLNAATEVHASRLLDLINYKSSNCPRKLHITGGGLSKLDPYKYRFLKVETLRLRHLHDLHLKWLDCQKLFPKLNHVEILKCPNLIFFPCDDNGIWEKSEQS